MIKDLEIEEGWHQLVQPLFDYIEKYNHEKEDSEKIRVKQCKEKFGTLRFYTTNDTEELDNLIKEAEQKSAVTCECCGKPGKLRSRNYWLKTLCDNCAKELGYEKA